MKIMNVNKEVLYEDSERDISKTLANAVSQGTQLYHADLQGLDLSGSPFMKAKLDNADFRGANLIRAHLENSGLHDTKFDGASMRLAEFSGADLSGATFGGADLHNVCFEGADLTETDLIDGGQRSDGYRHIGQVKEGELWILAGCYYFTLSEALTHWNHCRAGKGLSKESLVICERIHDLAVARNMLPAD